MLPKRKLMHTKKIAIDMAEDWSDVNEEYEKIFGSAKRVNLFDTEEEYNELRKYIMSEPQVTYLTNMLPFEGIEISIGNEHKQERINNKEILNILESLRIKHKETNLLKKEKESIETDKHLFYIKEPGVCDASGYYNKELNYFFICKDSLVSYDTDIIYMNNDKEKARENFLNKICEKDEWFYRVIRDAKCRSASAAACYVLGYESDQTSWKDSEGRLLTDVYPDIFSNPIENEVKNKWKIDTSKQDTLAVEKPKQHDVKKNTLLKRPPRYYYITREGAGERNCNAKGEYDKNSDKFVILAGSELAHEVTTAYRYSASDIKRNKFIQKYCGLSRYDFKVKKDGICNSPDEAACFVLGENANGWVEWKSKDGISLESYITKV